MKKYPEIDAFVKDITDVLEKYNNPENVLLRYTLGIFYAVLGQLYAGENNRFFEIVDSINSINTYTLAALIVRGADDEEVVDS